MAPIEAVFIPTLSRVQAEPERYRRIHLQVYEVVATACFLFTGLLFGLAHPLTLVVLGPKWEKAASVFAALTLVALYAPVASVAGWLLTSQGRGRDFLVLSSIASSVTVVAFAAALPFGPIGIAISYSGTCLLIHLPLTYHFAGRRGPVSTKDLWILFFKHLPLWCVTCAATCLSRSWIVNASPLAQLVICGPIGLLAGSVFIYFYLPSRRAALSLFDALLAWQRSRLESPS